MNCSFKLNSFAHIRILWELFQVVELILWSWPLQEQVRPAPSVTMVIYPGYHSEQLARIVTPGNWSKPKVSRMTGEHRLELQVVEDVKEKQPCWNKQKTYFPSWWYSKDIYHWSMKQISSCNQIIIIWPCINRMYTHATSQFCCTELLRTHELQSETCRLNLSCTQTNRDSFRTGADVEIMWQFKLHPHNIHTSGGLLWWSRFDEPLHPKQHSSFTPFILTYISGGSWRSDPAVWEPGSASWAAVSLPSLQKLITLSAFCSISGLKGVSSSQSGTVSPSSA